MRGKLSSFIACARSSRSTPAGAGKTKSSSVRLFAHRDHPRGCGENDEAGAIEFNELGSPPQVRGKPNADTAVWAVSGITPAGAGKTPALRSGFRINKDHPRRCGENLQLFCGQYARGITPAGAGKHRLSKLFHRGYRITPAGAGKTAMLLSSRCLRDHPRRCGKTT